MDLKEAAIKFDPNGKCQNSAVKHCPKKKLTTLAFCRQPHKKSLQFAVASVCRQDPNNQWWACAIFLFFVLSRSCVLERCTFAICTSVTFLKKCCSATVCISTSRNLNFFQQSATLKIAALQWIAEVRN